jgi:hypothetical protein
MKRGRKTWTEKLNPGREPKVVKLEQDFAGIPAGSHLLVATPRVVERYIKQIPKGTSVSPQTLRRDLASEYKADATCPISTGIFLRIVAEAAYEQHQAGKSLKEIAPFWRVIDEKSPAAKRLTCGAEFVKTQRTKEGLAA